jgi:hypothetical protein
MSDLVLYENGGTLTQQEEELLWERVATHYLRLQDERRGRKVKVDDALRACLEAHPNEYVEVVAKAAIKTKDFDEYLAQRRKDHLIRSLVPELVAAEWGTRAGEMAWERIVSKMEDGEDVPMKDLIAVAKLGYELAAKADKRVEEVTETPNVKVNIDLKGLLLGLPSDMAADYMAEIGRRMISGEK